MFPYFHEKNSNVFKLKKKTNFLHGPNGFFPLSFGHKKKKSKKELTKQSKHYFVKLIKVGEIGYSFFCENMS